MTLSKNMPNHITNRLQIIGSNPEVVFDFIRSKKNEDDLFDFNLIVPTPEEIEAVGEPSSRVVAAAYEIAKSLAEMSVLKAGHLDIQKRYRVEPEYYSQLEKAVRAVRKTGFAYWYDWRVQNWDTKWGAYNFRREGNFLFFETAWSFPETIIFKLSKLFAAHTFKIAWADEDTGHNTGKMVIKNGVLVEGGYFINGSNEAFENAFQLNPDIKEHFRLIDGEYKLYDEDDEIEQKQIISSNEQPLTNDNFLPNLFD